MTCQHTTFIYLLTYLIDQNNIKTLKMVWEIVYKSVNTNQRGNQLKVWMIKYKDYKTNVQCDYVTEKCTQIL